MTTTTAALIWRTGLTEPKVALLQRRGETQWTFPGGPALPNEAWATAADRHAKETMERAVRLTSFADASSTAGRPTRLYWDFSLADFAPDTLETQAGKLWFVTPAEALTLLVDEGDRQVLRRHAAPSTAATTLTLAQRIRFFTTGSGVSYEQLRRQLQLSWAEQHDLEQAGLGEAAIQARLELQSAERLGASDPETAWVMLKRARRTQLRAMSARQRNARWAVIREEAKSKLRSWRADSAKKLMEAPANDVPVVENMIAVAELLDGHHDAFFDRSRLIQQRLAWMTLLLFLSIPALELCWSASVMSATSPQLFGVDVVRLAPLLGIVGALCSSLVSSLTSNSTKRPQVVLDSTLVFGRVALGAGSGLGMALVTGGSGSSAIVVAALTFAAGFSERALPAQIDKLFGETAAPPPEAK